MPEIIASRFRLTPIIVFLVVSGLVFFLVAVISTIITFKLPESFAGRERVLVDSDTRTVCEVIRSQAVLGKVVDRLQLNIQWGKKYLGGEVLTMAESIELLNNQIAIIPPSDTRLIDITVYSNDRNEAVQIADAVADCYNDYYRDLQKRAELDHSSVTIPKIEIVDRATPELIPERPNKPLNIAIELLAGIILGLLFGGIGAFIASRLGQRKSAGQAAGSGGGLISP